MQPEQFLLLPLSDEGEGAEIRKGRPDRGEFEGECLAKNLIWFADLQIFQEGEPAANETL
jgi:hypothetical protein